MKDTNGHKQQNGPEGLEGSQESTIVSYTPQERNLIRKGLRIWVKVAVRSYMKRHGLGLDGSQLAKDEDGRGAGAGVKRDEIVIDPEGPHAI